MDIRELLTKRANLWEEAKKFLDEHTDADGKISAEDAATVERMIDQIDAMARNIDAQQRLDDWGKELLRPFNKPHFEPFGNKGGDTLKRAVSGVRGDEYKKNFLDAVRKNFKAESTGYLHEGTLPGGGYLLPVEMHEAILTELEGECVLRQIGRTITTASEHKITFSAQKPTATWIGEGEDIPLTDEKFGQISLGAYKLGVNLKISNELLQDACYDLESFIATEFGKAFGRAEEEAFLVGAPDVSGEKKQPTGILTVLNQSATGTIQTVGSQIAADDILSLFYSVDRAYRKNAVFLASDATISAVRKLKDSTQNFIWQPSMQEGEPPKIFGTPIYSSNFMPAPTSGNVALLFGDFRDFFVIAERGNRIFKPLRELYALSDKTGFLMLERIDCAITDTRAFRGLKIR